MFGDPKTEWRILSHQHPTGKPPHVIRSTPLLHGTGSVVEFTLGIVMDSVTGLRHGRYVLYLDILGFSDLVESRGAEDVYETIKKALAAFEHWEELNQFFRTIYFSH